MIDDQLIDNITKCEQQGLGESMEELCKQALSIDPLHKVVLNKLSFYYFCTKQFQKALDILEHPIEATNDLTFLNNKALCLWHSDRFTEALETFNQLEEGKKTDPGFYINRGTVHWTLNDYESALEDFRTAIVLDKTALEAVRSIGSMYVETGHYNLAFEYFNKALEIQPNDSKTLFLIGLGLLSQGKWSQGFPFYEYRPSVQDLPDDRKSKYFTSGKVAGKTFLISSEQGLGDTLLFARYLHLLAEQGAKIVLEVQRPLVPVFKDFSFISEVTAPGEYTGDYDYFCLLGSLLKLFNATPNTVPFRSGYLKADPVYVNKWSNLLGLSPKPRVGITWSGTKTAGDWNRSLTLEQFFKALPDGFEYVMLHTEIRQEDLPLLEKYNIKDYSRLLLDFKETMALMQCMDHVITTCTSTANLAGSLGKPFWVLVQHAMDWRWHNNSPFYSSATVYRQPVQGDWDSVLEQVNKDLTAKFSQGE